MKVGTDAVILGAWTKVDAANTILDIGSGCGILALMMAQRNREALITAVDIHKESVLCSMQNFIQSPWGERLQVTESNFRHFSEDSPGTYDLILSNPPYFVDSLKAPSAERSLSRHNENLPYLELLDGVRKLLNHQGRFSLILPFAQEGMFVELAARCSLYVVRMLHVRSKPGRPRVRSCIEFSREAVEPGITELIIRNENDSYTTEYRELTREFYLYRH